MPRALLRLRAETPVIAIARPARTATSLPWRSSMRTSALPTVPRPARQMRSGASMRRRSLDRTTAAVPISGAASDRSLLAARGRRHVDDVVQRLVRAFKEAADVARGLPDPLLVLDQRDTYVIVAVFAESDARRHRKVRLLDQQLGELEGAEATKFFRDRRPGEHGGARRRNRPAGAGEAFDQRIAPPLVGRAHLNDAFLRTVQRRRGGHLDRGEGPVIQVRFHPAERRDHALVADRKSDP